MRYLWGLILAGGMIVGQPEAAEAQFSLSIGNPYTGTGLTIGNPVYSYGYGPSYGYGTGYYGAPIAGAPIAGAPIAAPGYAYPYGGQSYSYSSGYSGYAPVVRPAVPGYYNSYSRGYSRFDRGFGGFGRVFGAFRR